MFRVQLVGLMYFHGCTLDAKRLYVPDGTKGSRGIPPHYASLFIDADLCEADEGWGKHKIDHELPVVDDGGKKVIVHVLEFRIPKPAELTFPDSEDRKAEFINLDTALPKLQLINPKFELDERHPETIAQVAIHGGRLEAFSFNQAAVVAWTIEKHSGPIVITSRRKGKTRSVTVKPEEGAEIVFSNTSNLIYEEHARRPVREIDPTSRMPQGESHFTLYHKLDVHRDSKDLNLTETHPRLPPLPVNNAYLRFLEAGQELPDYPCSPSCCSR